MPSQPRFKPTQAAGSFAGIPNVVGGSTGFSFAREYEVQDGLPLDGSNANLRTYSPFVIRVVLPSILNGDSSTVLQTEHSPRRVPPSKTVLSDNRDGPDYGQAQLESRVDPSGRAAFNRLVDQGGVLAGITKASTQSLEDAYNQAVFQQQFGPTVQRASQPQSNQRTNNVTPAITNDTSALSLVLQLKRLASIPPLLMLINPSSMKTEYTKVAQFQSRNRRGYQYEAWGEEMAKLSFTFRIGAYTAGRAYPTQRGVISGVQRASRNDSASYQQLMALLAMYQSGTYLQDTEGNSRAFLMVGNLAIEYDQMVYIGHMESFSFGDEETKQHGGLEIQIEFVANKVFDLAPQGSVVQPMQSPQLPASRTRGTLLSRGSGGTSLSLFSTPTVGGTSSLAGTANQAWESGTGNQTGSTTGVDGTGIVMSRRG